MDEFAIQRRIGRRIERGDFGGGGKTKTVHPLGISIEEFPVTDQGRPLCADIVGPTTIQADLPEDAFGFRRRLGSARETLQIDIDGCSPMHGVHERRLLTNGGIEALAVANFKIRRLLP